MFYYPFLNVWEEEEYDQFLLIRSKSSVFWRRQVDQRIFYVFPTGFKALILVAQLVDAFVRSVATLRHSSSSILIALF